MNTNRTAPGVCTEIMVFSNDCLTKGTLRYQPAFLQNGILQVGYRLQHSDETFKRKYLALLPVNNSVTNIIFRAIHLQISTHRLKDYSYLLWWEVSFGLCVVEKFFVSEMLQSSVNSVTAPNGTTSEKRVTLIKPFSIVGVYFAGPIQIKTELRKVLIVKAYKTVFVCMATKVVHLESI